MEDREFETKLEELMKEDFSVGTDAFREDLLSRCLAVLGADGGLELSDSELDMISAAGNPYIDKYPEI